ncbi:hypothetical protein OO013_18885 [Mangrovivirga sp. M17]|uniref:AI-2E family transporter n=1 Tax=Mangrovivirga halotolerans TaxID=2993936 RepID=A0ABT3RVZ8_9BACT|nr:hypothetical protein [Mangrovivirga halotolerans]MCX2745954.1 hypothetical protein [Mangrovivirga halotolerans]
MTRYYILLTGIILIAGNIGFVDPIVSTAVLLLVLAILILERFSSIRKYKKTQKLIPIFIIILAVLFNTVLANGLEYSAENTICENQQALDSILNFDENVVFGQNLFFKVLSFIVDTV